MIYMEYIKISINDYEIFHNLLNCYYREGEDENTPQEIIDSFVKSIFEKVAEGEYEGYFAKENNEVIGFSLWTFDDENFEYSEIKGFGTIMEIGFVKSYRGKGFGKAFTLFIESEMRKKNINKAYVSAFGPAFKFWQSCGYKENGKMASNGLPIMVKNLA